MSWYAVIILIFVLVVLVPFWTYLLGRLFGAGVLTSLGKFRKYIKGEKNGYEK